MKRRVVVALLVGLSSCSGQTFVARAPGASPSPDARTMPCEPENSIETIHAELDPDGDGYPTAREALEAELANFPGLRADWFTEVHDDQGSRFALEDDTMVFHLERFRGWMISDVSACENVMRAAQGDRYIEHEEVDPAYVIPD